HPATRALRRAGMQPDPHARPLPTTARPAPCRLDPGARSRSDRWEGSSIVQGDFQLATAPWASPAEEVVAALGSDAQRGLGSDEARRRLERVGRNELPESAPPSALRRLLAQFRDPLVLLLLAATAISVALWLVERAAPLPYEAIAILSVVLINALIGFLQQSR